MNKNKTIIALILLMLFFILSLIYICPINKRSKPSYRSYQLNKSVTKTDNTERIDYFDKNNEITVAVDLGFATSIATSNDNSSTLVEYYDEEGEPISRYPGYYSLLREYDEKGNVVCITYFDKKKTPIIINDGYAIEKREYDADNQMIAVKYFDKDGNPVCTPSYGYGKINEYDECGMNTKTYFVDNYGKPMMTGSGYASVIKEYYVTNGPENGQIKNELYFNEHEMPTSLSLGQYGVHYEYNEKGQKIRITYLDDKGNPIRTKKGYTTVLRSFSDTDAAISELYLDLEGNPFSLPEGQYGIKRENGQIIYLNKNGEESFNLKKLLYNSPWIIFPFAIIVIALSSAVGQKLNVILIIPYIIVIIYLTLMFRENIGDKGISILNSYAQFFTDSESRASIIKNIWLFIPLGAMLYRLAPKKSILIIPILLSLLVECVQLITQTGFCELDDVISNSLGGLIGFYVAKLTTEVKLRIKSWRYIHTA